MMRKTLILLVATMLPFTASATWPDSSVYLDIFGGIHLVPQNWDLHEQGNNGAEINHSPTVGVKIGGYPTWWFALEGSLGVLPLSTPDDGMNIALDTHVGALFHFTKTNWSPYAIVGGGFYFNVEGDLGKDADYNAFYGLGVIGQFNHWLGMRLQARHIFTDGNNGEPGLANNIEVIAALRVNLWRTADDRDKDGILDKDDSCPDTPGHASAAGCPDRDGDGIQDKDDACPDTPGVPEHDGCPDRDKDGIIDSKDACPDTWGLAVFKGCPDRDNDGIIDSKDKCPDDPEDKDGFEDEDGCPDEDNDKDTILDPVDKCPNEPETKNGYKDEDGCPDVPPVVVKDKEIIILEKVFFEFNKADIKAESHEVLNAVAQVLKDYPDIVKVQVEGHTDDVGSNGKNLRLSQRRADSVVAYLVGKGTDKSRLVAKGYGESSPLIKETTEEARAKNRRVEFKILKRDVK